MLFFILGGCLLAHLAEKETSRRVVAKRLRSFRERYPELEIVPGKSRVYLTTEQMLLGEGGDPFLFVQQVLGEKKRIINKVLEISENALATVSRERSAAEDRARSILQP